MPTKLRDLRPEFGATGIEGRFFLTFDCPTTPKGRVYVQFHRGPSEVGVWQCTSPWKVTPGLEHLGELPDIDCLSLLPSIGDHSHGRTGRCTGHVNVHNGEITP